MGDMVISIEMGGIKYEAKFSDEVSVDVPLRSFTSLLVAAGYSEKSIEKVLGFDYKTIEGWVVPQ